MQRLCVDGSGPNVSLCASAAAAQRVEHDAGLHAREPALRIELEDPVHVLREIEHDRDVAALAGEARAGAARQHRRAELAADRDGRRDVVGVAGHDEADRNLAVVRARRWRTGRGCPDRSAPRPRSACFLSALLELGRAHRACAVRRRGAGASDLSAAITPPSRCGTPASRRPISTPLSVPASIRSLKLPRWPMRKTWPASFDEPDAERHVEVIEDERAQIVGVVAVRHEDRRHRVRVLARILADDLEAPRAHGGARRLAVARVTREDVGEAFLFAASAAPRAGRRTDSSPACTGRSPSRSALMISSQSK